MYIKLRTFQHLQNNTTLAGLLKEIQKSCKTYKTYLSIYHKKLHKITTNNLLKTILL